MSNNAAIPQTTVQAHDSFQNPRRSGGEAFAVQVQGVSRDSVQIKDRQDGTYLVEYCVPAEGTYQAHVTLHGAHVAGSPASITAYRFAHAHDNGGLLQKSASH